MKAKARRNAGDYLLSKEEIEAALARKPSVAAAARSIHTSPATLRKYAKIHGIALPKGRPKRKPKPKAPPKPKPTPTPRPCPSCRRPMLPKQAWDKLTPLDQVYVEFHKRGHRVCSVCSGSPLSRGKARGHSTGQKHGRSKTHSNPDARTRELQRRWHESGTDEDFDAYVHALARTDPLLRVREEVLRAAGYAVGRPVEIWGRGVYKGQGPTQAIPDARADYLRARVSQALEAHRINQGAFHRDHRNFEWRPRSGIYGVRAGNFVVVVRGPHAGRVERIGGRSGTRKFCLGSPPAPGDRPPGLRTMRDYVQSLTPIEVQAQTVGEPCVGVYDYQVLTLPRGLIGAGVFHEAELPIFLYASPEARKIGSPRRRTNPWRRMRNPDAHTRDLERRFRATGDPDLGPALRRGYERANELPPEDLWDALYPGPDLARLYDEIEELPPRELWRRTWGTERSERLRDVLERVVFPWPTVEGTTTYSGGDVPTLRLDDPDTAYVCVVGDVHSHGPHPGQMAIEQNRYHASRDTVLQAAFEGLENDLRDLPIDQGAMQDCLADAGGDEVEAWERYDTALRESTQYFFLDGLSPREAAAAIVGTRWEERGAVEIEDDVDEDYWDQIHGR